MVSIDDKFILKEKLLRRGGVYLATARTFLQWHVRGGDTCQWGSQQILPISVAQIEEMAAEIAAAVLVDSESVAIAAAVQKG